MNILCRVLFVVSLNFFHNGFALHYKYDPRWKWKENQFVDLHHELYMQESDDADTSSETVTTPSSTYPPVIQGTSEGADEDLLDLMVRIAETPSEWEKIHQVLNQLGKNKNKSNSSQNKPKHHSKLTTQKDTSPTISPSTTTSTTPNTTTKPKVLNLESTVKPASRLENIYKESNIHKDKSIHNEILKITDTKPVWPDIFKNEYEKLFWNAQNVYDEEIDDEDDEDEENYFSQYQWDEEDRNVNKDKLNVNSISKFPSKSAHVNKKASKMSSKAGRVNNFVHEKSHNDLSVVNSDVNNKKYEFVHFLSRAASSTVRPVNATTDDVQNDNGESKNTRSKDENWPNFSYHRVTVNPNKEKFKNLSKAFIVVSEISPKSDNRTIRKGNEDSVSESSQRNGALHEGDDVQKESSIYPHESSSSREEDPIKDKVYRHHWKNKGHSKRRHRKNHEHEHEKRGH